MRNIVSIKGDFKLNPDKINSPFRDFYIQITNHPIFTLNNNVSAQFANNSLQVLNLNLVEGELSGKIIPPAKSMKTNEVWYFNHFISLKPLVIPTSDIIQSSTIFQKGSGIEWQHLLKQLSELNSIDREEFIYGLPPDLIDPAYIDVLKNAPDSILEPEIKKSIENKLLPFFEEFKAK